MKENKLNGKGGVVEELCLRTLWLKVRKKKRLVYVNFDFKKEIRSEIVWRDSKPYIINSIKDLWKSKNNTKEETENLLYRHIMN